MTALHSVDRDGEFVYDPKGTPRTFRNGERINWSGRDPDWTDRLGYRGAREIEKPAGEWNRLEVVVEPDRITNILNGIVVNVGTSPTYTRGKIIVQSEGAEIFVRRVDLYPNRTVIRTGSGSTGTSEPRSTPCAPVPRAVPDVPVSPVRRSRPVAGCVPVPFPFRSRVPIPVPGSGCRSAAGP